MKKTSIESSGSRTLLTGAQAIAYGVQASRTQVITACPIVPQTPIIEQLGELCANGQLEARFVRVESEHSAMASLVGASAAGVRTFTATSSHGLALMHEMLHWAAGNRLPIVMANVNRALGAPWSIWVDHNDSLSQRDTGWIQFYVSSNQEALDTIPQAFRLAETVRLPVMVNLDGFYLTHTLELVQHLDQGKVDQFLPKWLNEWKLDVEDPRSIGNITTPDHYSEFRLQMQQAMEQAKEEVDRIEREFALQFGREYRSIESYEIEDAEVVFICYASMASTVKHTVMKLRREGKKVGLIRIRLFRPFPAERLREIIREGTRYIVLDRNISFGVGGIFAQEIRNALFQQREHIEIADVCLGLGGRDVTPDTISALVNRFAGGNVPATELHWEGVKS